MPPFDIDRAASLLIEGRRSGRQVQAFRPGPSGPEESYAGMIFVEPGATVEAVFPGVGRTVVRFS